MQSVRHGVEPARFLPDLRNMAGFRIAPDLNPLAVPSYHSIYNESSECGGSTRLGTAMTDNLGAKAQFVAFDLETTGLTAAADRIVEIGAVRFLECGRELGRYQRLINPERPMPAGAQAIHGISDTDLAGASPARDVLPEFIEFLGDPRGSVLLAHNASFDAGFLGCELTRAGLPIAPHPVIDTLALARRHHPGLSNHRLETVARHLGVLSSGGHRALADSLCVKEIWLRMSGPAVAPDMVVSYPMHDSGRAVAPPVGWERVETAIDGGRAIRIEYDGGTRGRAARSITPRRFVQRGGQTYLVAFCHLDSFEKSFRIDRILALELVCDSVPVPVHVDPASNPG
jgi:DNA polymerase III subunit epsilon